MNAASRKTHGIKDDFRNDVTLDGRINNQDLQTVRSHRDESLP